MSKFASAILHLLVVILIATLILFLWPVPAKAQGAGTGTEEPIKNSQELACGEHADFVSTLTEKYEEVQIGIGIVKNEENVVELFVSPQGTWSLLVTYITGENPTCLVASGKSWQGIAPIFLTPS